MAVDWYLVRTKAGEERRASECLARCSDEVLFPLLHARVRRWGKTVETVVPLFTCYLFAQFDLTLKYNQVRHTSGVQYLVHYGEEFAPVPGWIITDIKARCSDGPIRPGSRELRVGETIRIIDGPFRNFEGIFERQVSGSDRVAILLSAISANMRVVLSTNMVSSIS
jgi:transcription elongation factor/antiterminator RfaH